MLRRTPLRARRPLQGKKGLSGSGQLKRSPLQKRSQKNKKSSYQLERIRKLIIQRDKGACILCGRPYEEMHHINFRSAGGTHTEDNLVCLCWRCHHEAHGVRSKAYKQMLRRVMSERYGYEYEA